MLEGLSLRRITARPLCTTSSDTGRDFCNHAHILAKWSPWSGSNAEHGRILCPLGIQTDDACILEYEYLEQLARESRIPAGRQGCLPFRLVSVSTRNFYLHTMATQLALDQTAVREYPCGAIPGSTAAATLSRRARFDLAKSCSSTSLSAQTGSLGGRAATPNVTVSFASCYQ